MNACPFGPEWDALVAVLGAGNALTAYRLNNEQMPTLEEAEKILASLKLEEKDEQVSRSSDEWKLQRAVEQRTNLEILKLSANPAQKATLDKFIEMNERQQEFHRQNVERIKAGKNPVRTVSVSHFIGNSDFKGDPKEFEAFKLFGTFMHEVLELAQVESLKSGISIDRVLTRDFFNERMQEYQKKTPFYINELSDDMMYEMAEGIARIVGVNNSRGMLILPEITITGNDVNGRMVIGRMDLMLIDSQGKVQILDFKTKKVKNMVYKNNDGTVDVSKDRAFVELAEKEFPITPNPLTAQRLQRGKRTAYDTWTLQLKVYENILEQNGIDTSNSAIVSLMYQTDDEKNFMGHEIHQFELDNYYDYAGTASVLNNNGFWVKDPTVGQKRIQSLRDVVDKEIPTGKTTETQEVTPKNPTQGEFELNQEQNERLRSTLESAINRELDDILRMLRKLEEKKDLNKPLIEQLKTRRQTLTDFKGVLKRMSLTDLNYSFNYSLTLEALSADIRELNTVVSEIMGQYNNDRNSVSRVQIEQIKDAHQKAQAMSEVMQTLKEILNEAIANPANKITAESESMKRLSEVEIALSNIDNAFKRITLLDSVKVLMTPGEKTFVKVNEEMREVLEAKRVQLLKQIEGLKQGKASSWFQQLKGQALSLMDKDFKAQLAAKQNAPDAQTLTNIERLEKSIQYIDLLLQGGLEYNEQALEKYIENITNPDSPLYLGNANPLGSSWLSGLRMDRAIASASNSELGVSSFVMMHKNAEAVANRNMQNALAKMEFDRKRDELMKRMSVEELNQKVSQTREVMFYNKETGAVETKRMLFMSKPYSEQYESTYRNHYINQRLLNREIYDLKDQYNEAFKKDKDNGTNTRQAIKDQLDQKTKQRDDMNRRHNEWMLANCHLPYVEAFYQLQNLMPEDIRDELQTKYFEMETIVAMVGFGNEVLLEDHDFDRLSELEDEIRVLKDKARKINPAYEQYIEQFNELWEFEPSTRYYERMEANARTRFEVDDPERWQKWLRENTISRPKAEWYEDMSALYEQRASLFGSDPRIENLMEQRRRILAPHRVGGRLRVDMLKADEVEKLDLIEENLNEIFEENMSTGGRLTKDEITIAKELARKIKEMRKQELSPRYEEEFRKRTKALEGKFNLMMDAESKLAAARTKGTAAEITAAEQDYMDYAAQFSLVEKDYSEWYNMVHNNKYVSLLDGGNVYEKAPKSYNYENLPGDAVAAQYMETVPHPKYKIKRLKESARNPDFLKSPDGIPMPKAIVKNSQGNYVIKPGFENSNNVSQHYKEMMRDPEVFSFYNDVMDLFFELQTKVEGRKIGYQVPGFAATSIENIASKGFAGSIKANWQRFLDKSIKTYGSQDAVENLYGEMGARLRHRFTDQLPEELQTKDAIGAVMKYAVEANYNIAMQDVAPQADSYIKHLEYLAANMQKQIQSGTSKDPEIAKRLGELSNMIDILKFERDKFQYGKTESASGLNRVIKKRINNFFAYTSFIRIGFDIANQTKNYLSGNVQAFIAAGGVESDHYGRKDYMWAKGKVYGTNGFLHNYFKDYGKVSDLHLTTMLYRFYNPAQKEFLKYMEEITGGRSRRLKGKTTQISELGFMLQDKGDTEIAVTVMYAVMNAYRYKVIDQVLPDGTKVYKKDANGDDVTVPVHEIYEKANDGTLYRRNDVDFTEDDENRIRNIIYSEMRRAQGNYAKSDMTMFEQGVAGKLVFFFRKYLVPQFLNRFGYLRPNWEGAEAALGYWTAVKNMLDYYGPGQAAKHLILGANYLNKTNKNLAGKFLTRKVAQARRDMIAMGILTALSTLALMYVRRKDEDDEELSMIEGNLIRILWGIKGETTSMFPIGGGSEEYIRNFTTVTVLTSELKKMKNALSHGINYGIAMSLNGGDEPTNDDSQFYTESWKDAFYTKKSGRFDKGDAKITKDFLDMTGVRNFQDLVDPNVRIDQIKRNQ